MSTWLVSISYMHVAVSRWRRTNSELCISLCQQSMCISVVGCGAVACLRSYICMPQIWSDSHSIECGGRSVVWWSLAQVKFWCKTSAVTLVPFQMLLIWLINHFSSSTSHTLKFTRIFCLKSEKSWKCEKITQSSLKTIKINNKRVIVQLQLNTTLVKGINKHKWKWASEFFQKLKPISWKENTATFFLQYFSSEAKNAEYRL